MLDIFSRHLQPIIREVKDMLTPSQRDLLFPYIEKVPMGVILILGPA
jgi:hypothetical protein